MPTIPITSASGSYLLDANGDYVVADQTAPNGPLVTANVSLTSKARHVISRASATVVARSSGKEVFTRGGTSPLVTPKSPLVVR